MIVTAAAEIAISFNRFFFSFLEPLPSWCSLAPRRAGPASFVRTGTLSISVISLYTSCFVTSYNTITAIRIQSD